MNPFDDPDGSFLVLLNEEGQYSLWPSFAEIPAGWKVTHGPAGHKESMDFIGAGWTDLRPVSLVSWLAEQ